MGRTGSRLDPVRALAKLIFWLVMLVVILLASTALGLESTRGWCAKTVLRAGPCLLGPYTVVAALFAALPESERAGGVSWPGKATVTFSDALCAVRRWLWAEAVLPQAGDGRALQKLPEPVRELLLTTLAPAASGRDRVPAWWRIRPAARRRSTTPTRPGGCRLR